MFVTFFHELKSAGVLVRDSGINACDGSRAASAAASTSVSPW